MVDHSEYLEIVVEDTGIGIAKKDQKKLFKLFGFLQDSKKLNTKGIGLGLVISDKIVQKFNGSVTFTSEVGVGSKFKFTFQLRDPNVISVDQISFQDSQKFMLDQKQLYNEWKPRNLDELNYHGIRYMD